MSDEHLSQAPGLTNIGNNVLPRQYTISNSCVTSSSIHLFPIISFEFCRRPWELNLAEKNTQKTGGVVLRMR